MRPVAWCGLISFLVIAALPPQPLRSQGAPDSATVRGRDDTEAQQLFGRLMSPFCPGLTLATCPSPGADSLREDIRSRLDRGETPRAITAAYVADWGERMLGAPPVRDWGVVLWALPVALLAAGFVGLALWLARVSRGRPDRAAPAPVCDEPPLDPEWKERLEKELESYEESLG